MNNFIVISLLIATAACQAQKLKCKSEVAPEICFLENQKVVGAQDVTIELSGNFKVKPNDIKRLYLINTALPNEIPGVFYITFPNLWLLSLKNTSLTEWKGEYLKGATQLKVLYIVDNQIETFDEEAFAEVPRLEELWIENSKIITINPNMFKPFNALKELNLSYHKHLQPPTAEQLALVKESLIFLDLSGNYMNNLTTGMFTDFEKLEVLCLNDCFNFTNPLDATQIFPLSLKRLYIGWCLFALKRSFV